MNMNNKIDMNNKNRDMSNKKFAIIGSLIGLIILLIISTGIAAGIDPELQSGDSGVIAQELKIGKTEYFKLDTASCAIAFVNADILKVCI